MCRKDGAQGFIAFGKTVCYRCRGDGTDSEVGNKTGKRRKSGFIVGCSGIGMVAPEQLEFHLRNIIRSENKRKTVDDFLFSSKGATILDFVIFPPSI